MLLSLYKDISTEDNSLLGADLDLYSGERIIANYRYMMRILLDGWRSSGFKLGIGAFESLRTFHLMIALC